MCYIRIGVYFNFLKPNNNQMSYVKPICIFVFVSKIMQKADLVWQLAWVVRTARAKLRQADHHRRRVSSGTAALQGHAAIFAARLHAYSPPSTFNHKIIFYFDTKRTHCRMSRMSTLNAQCLKTKTQSIKNLLMCFYTVDVFLLFFYEKILSTGFSPPL